MDEAQLESAFELEMFRIYREAYDKCKHRATIFHQMLIDHGGRETARRLLSQHGLQYGFEKICERGYCHITMESLVLRVPWRQLFSDKERAVALARLQTYRYAFDHGEVI